LNRVWALAGAAVAVVCFAYVGGRYWQRHRAQIAEWRRAAEFQEMRQVRKEERRRQRDREIAREERLQRWKATQEARQRLKHGASPLASAVGSPQRFVHVSKGGNTGNTNATNVASSSSSSQQSRHHRTPSGRLSIAASSSSDSKAAMHASYDPYPSDTRTSSHTHGHHRSASSSATTVTGAAAAGGERKTMARSSTTSGRDSRDQSSDDDISDVSSVDAVPIVLATPIATSIPNTATSSVTTTGTVAATAATTSTSTSTIRSGIRWGPSTTQTIPALDDIVETDSDLPSQQHGRDDASDDADIIASMEDMDNDNMDHITDTNDEPAKCVVCRDQPANVAMIPCGHTHCCMTCASRVAKCPICRANVTDRLRVYT
jgi:hypothetical protein